MKADTKLLILLIIIAVTIIGVNLTNPKKKASYKTQNEVLSLANYIDEEKDNKEVVVEEVQTVYDGLTMDQLTDKLNRSLNSTISGKGYLIASYSLERGVDPYMSTAIILHETGCKWNCSYLVNTCNNVGGQKGSGCGNYSYFSSLDEGIMAFIDNLYNNYVSLGLTTPEAINPKYAESTSWALNVNKYIENIKQA